MSKLFRVLHIASYYKPAYIYGGPARSIPAMCEALARLGAQVTVLTTNANGPSQRLDVPLGQPVMLDGVEVLYYPLVAETTPMGRFFYSPRLAEAIRRKVIQYDIVTLDALWSHVMGPAISACKSAGVPYVVSLRGQLLPWALSHKGLKKRLYLTLFGRHYLDGAAALRCTSPAEAEAVAALGLQPPTFVVPNSVDISRFSHLPERGSLRQRLSIPTEAIVMLFLGRLHQVKCPNIAIEALAAAQSLPREIYLVMAGPDEGQMTSELQALAQELDCAGYLHMVGLLECNEVLHALTDADLLLMPSHSENFGMSALEAMAAGVPILVSDSVPVGHWAEEVGAGLVVPCTAEAFAQAVCKLLADPGQLKIMGERGRELARQHFDSSVVAQQMLAQYHSIVSSGKPLPAFDWI